MDNSAQNNSNKVKNTVRTVHYYDNKSLLANDVSFHWWRGGTTSLHNHDFYEFFIITDNKTHHEINGRREELYKGTLYMIRPDDVHRFTDENELSCIHINLGITKSHLEKVCDALKISLEKLCREKSLKTMLSSEELSFFVRRARMLNLMLSDNKAQANTLICELITQAITVISNSKVVSNTNYPPWFIELLEKIHSPENLSISAKEVYALGGFSPPVMINYFKRYTGKTVNAYLKEQKCENACRLLTSTQLSTLEISNALGYDSLSHFNRIFKEFTGVSPAVYRNNR